MNNLPGSQGDYGAAPKPLSHIEENLVDNGSMPVARIYKESMLEVPRELYIPPDALLLYLENFEGPLDLLLYLIRKEKFNILDIPMAVLTRQYLDYVESMREHHLNLAAEYLVMAATLIDIKCRMLLPRAKDEILDEEALEDPRADLVRRLLQYEQIQKAAIALNKLPQVDRNFFWGQSAIELGERIWQPEVVPEEFILVWQALLTRIKSRAHFEVKAEALSLREQMTYVLRQLQEHPERFVDFSDLFTPSEVMRRVVGFVAILELARMGYVNLEQAQGSTLLFVKWNGIEAEALASKDSEVIF